ncbi:MAG: CinA family protein [Dehalococcoidia bacterium]|nr:CinA family protein [Dehalococcoidia bacterium]
MSDLYKSGASFTPVEASKLAQRVISKCTELGLTIATAESTTGGLVGHLLVSVPGASKVFIGGITAYHGRPKINLLNVDRETLIDSGSVSHEAAIKMAEGSLSQFDVDISLSESGIASTTGNPDRPGGLYALSLIKKSGTAKSELLLFSGNRTETMYSASATLFQWILENIEA